MSSKISAEQLSEHNKKDDLWISINGVVYDVTGFVNSHPGKEGPLLHYAGKNGSEGFNKVHPTMDISKAPTVKVIGTFDCSKDSIDKT
jgi:L-lactate dehydrogenase (cytochrome)